MSVLSILAVLFAALIGLLLVYAATRPDGFRIERSAAGKGAAYAWEGNRNVGSGRMEITESTPASRKYFNMRHDDFTSPPGETRHL